ncbi:hypothetical protein EV385_5196 [Krasilnikovia cinnamomea]|uniref:Uncharacterized protein n=1 Tax=Krasilnikovia cinnamomea TaxID=349313 RepID=A0A4V2G7P0_9ACTN|nr:hypothetical protein EV385_5196 [Krasilnikovia cinnamomea]
MKALVVAGIGRTLPWSLPAYDWPFSAFHDGVRDDWPKVWLTATATLR